MPISFDLQSYNADVQSQALWVGKHGNDANDGSSIERAKFTFGSATTAASALTPSPTNLIAINCLDAGRYNEQIVVPDFVSIFANMAEIYYNDAVIEVADDSEVHFKTVRNTNASGTETSGACIRKRTGNSLSRVYIGDAFSGGAGTVIINEKNGSQLFARVEKATVVGDNGTGVGGSTLGTGHIHLYAGDIYLQGNNATAITSAGTGSNGGNIVGFVEHILPIGGSTGGTAFRTTGAAPGTPNISVVVSQIINLDNLYSMVNGTLHFMVADITPGMTRTQTGGTITEISPERFWSDGYMFIRNNTAPADGDLANSEMAIWFDDTPAAAGIQFKGKDSGGTVVTGSVAMT